MLTVDFDLDDLDAVGLRPDRQVRLVPAPVVGGPGVAVPRLGSTPRRAARPPLGKLKSMPRRHASSPIDPGGAPSGPREAVVAAPIIEPGSRALVIGGTVAMPGRGHPPPTRRISATRSSGHRPTSRGAHPMLASSIRNDRHAAGGSSTSTSGARPTCQAGRRAASATRTCRSRGWTRSLSGKVRSSASRSPRSRSRRASPDGHPAAPRPRSRSSSRSLRQPRRPAGRWVGAASAGAVTASSR